MLYLTLNTPDPANLYLDVHHVEHTRQRGLSISATLGDGCDEGEVLVELGLYDSVTFADMLPGSGLPHLLQRHDRQSVRQAVLLACAEAIGTLGGRRDKAHGLNPQLGLFEPPRGEVTVQESAPRWQAVH